MAKEQVLTDEELDEQFRAMIDKFIDHANEFAEVESIENVGMALLYAASRFNSFVVSQHAKSQEAYESDIPKARAFFLQQYEEMLNENLEDYKQVFQKYAHLTPNAKNS